MNQKGFIQIPLLVIVIASIIAVSLVAGSVLYKQGKLALLVADISEVFERIELTGTSQSDLQSEPNIQQEVAQEQEPETTPEETSEATTTPEIIPQEAQTQPTEIGIQEFYQDVLKDLGPTCYGCILKSGTLPDGTPYSVKLYRSAYKGVVKEYYILRFWGEYWPLDFLIKYEVKPATFNKTRLYLLRNCQFMSEPQYSEIRSHINIGSDNIYYDAFVGEGKPIPVEQDMDVHPACNKFLQMDAVQQEEWANKLVELGQKYHPEVNMSDNGISRFSLAIATLLWGW